MKSAKCFVLMALTLGGLQLFAAAGPPQPSPKPLPKPPHCGRCAF